MALLKFFEGNEGSYSSSSHSGGLYFAKDTGVILFKGIRYGGQPDLSGYANKSDISSLQGQISKKANIDHTHKIEDISDLILANSDHDGLMPSSMYEKLNELEMINSFDLSYTPGSDYVDIHGALSSEESGNLPNGQPSFRLSAATSASAGVMSSYDKKKLDNLVGDKSIVKRVFFNHTLASDSPINTLNRDIEVENNKIGFLFGSPLIARYSVYVDPTGDSELVKTIQVTMLDATPSRNGYMTETQAGQLSSLYTSHGGKSYLPLSGGTVNGNVTVNGKITANGLVIPVNYYAKYEGWLAQSFINDFGGKAECSFQTYTSNGELRFVRQTKANVDVAGQGDYTYIVYNANGNIQLANQRTIINYSDGSITTPKITTPKMTQTSDKRLKENINTITEDLDKIKEIEFFEFNLKDDVNKTKSYGVIAQDLEKVGLENLVVEEADGYKSVDYNALLILEIQRLRNEIDILKSKIS